MKGRQGLWSKRFLPEKANTINLFPTELVSVNPAFLRNFKKMYDIKNFHLIFFATALLSWKKFS